VTGLVSSCSLLRQTPMWVLPAGRFPSSGSDLAGAEGGAGTGGKLPWHARSIHLPHDLGSLAQRALIS